MLFPSHTSQNNHVRVYWFSSIDMEVYFCYKHGYVNVRFVLHLSKQLPFTILIIRTWNITITEFIACEGRKESKFNHFIVV